MRRDQALVSDLGISHRVQFRGSVPQAELRTYYNAATVLVIPSHYESFGLAAVEALACGTPVIGSMVGVFRRLFAMELTDSSSRGRQPSENCADRISRWTNMSRRRQL